MASLNMDGWMKTNKATKKSKNKTDVVNEVFKKIADKCSDVYWNQILTDCAMNDCPKPFFVSNNCLIFKKMKKQESIEIIDDDEDDTSWLKYVNFIKKYSTMRSKRDVEDASSENKPSSKPLVEMTTWAEVYKNSHYSQYLLQKYISEISIKHELNRDQINKFSGLLNLSVKFGTFMNEYIKISDGKIRKIDGVKFNEEKYLLPCQLVEYMNKYCKCRISSNYTSENLPESIFNNTITPCWKDLGEYDILRSNCVTKKKEKSETTKRKSSSSISSIIKTTLSSK